jgi:hypothetical protein
MQSVSHFRLFRFGRLTAFSPACISAISPSATRDELLHADQPSAADSPLEVADDVDEAALARVMRTVPLGAGVLAGSAVALLVAGYLLIYILVFIPRGTVG